MNITNRDYFTFNVDNSMLLVGQTGTGKTELVRKLLRQFEAAYTPEQMKYALFDMKQVEFANVGDGYLPKYLYFDVVINPDIGLDRLDELAEESERRISSGGEHTLLFIYIEECDIAATDQNRFDNAVITINKNAKKANMKLIYSTSRPAPDVVSKELIASFDLILAGQLASEIDAKHLGIPYRSTSEPFSFLVTQHSDIYDDQGEHLEMLDISKIETSFGGDNEPHDDYLSELLKKAYRSEIDCHMAVIPMDLIVPFSDFKPSISQESTARFMESYKAKNPPDLYVYEKDGKFIMSDDYNSYYLYKSVEATLAICIVIGETSITEGVKYGPPFKLQLPSIEMNW